MARLKVAATIKVRDGGGFHQAGATEAEEKVDSGIVFGS